MKTALLLNLCKSPLLSPFYRSRLLTPIWAHAHPPPKFYMASSPQATAWEGGVEGVGSLPENTSAPCCPSDPFSVQIYLYHFLEYWVPLFMTWHGLSHLLAWGGGWYHGSHLSQTECFIQGLSCPYLSPPSRARAQSVFVPMNWFLLFLKYAHCWVSSTGQRIFSTGQEFRRQGRKDHGHFQRQTVGLEAGTQPPPTWASYTVYQSEVEGHCLHNHI